MKFFLDIDGVMVHANPHKRVELAEDGFYIFNPTAVDVLNSVINPNEDELILTTSHRFRFTVAVWNRIFRERSISVSRISVLDLPLQSKTNRKDEIINWIDKCKFKADDIVIVDDDKLLNELPEYLKERLVLTDAYIGLNSDFKLKAILNKLN